MERIVVGVDGSEASRAALDWALDEARRRQAQVDVIHAWHAPYSYGYAYLSELSDEPMEQEAKELVESLLKTADTSGLTVDTIIAHGGSAGVLVEAAKGASLLVVGSRGRGGFTGLLLGSVSQQCVHHAPCPVVVVPS